MSYYTGVHHGYVFPSNVGGQEAGVQRSHRDPALKQPHGGQDLDSRHLFPQLEEITGSQHDNAQQDVPHHAERHCVLHHEVHSYNMIISYNSGIALIFTVYKFLFPGWLWVQSVPWCWWTFPWIVIFVLSASEAVSVSIIITIVILIRVLLEFWLCCHFVLPCRCLHQQWDCLHVEERIREVCGHPSRVLQLTAVWPHRTDALQQNVVDQYR